MRCHNEQLAPDRVAQNALRLLLPLLLHRKVLNCRTKEEGLGGDINSHTEKKDRKPFSGNRICESRERFQLQTKPCLFYLVGDFIAISVYLKMIKMFPETIQSCRRPNTAVTCCRKRVCRVFEWIYVCDDTKKVLVLKPVR